MYGKEMYILKLRNKRIITQIGPNNNNLREKFTLAPPPQIASEVTEIGRISVVMHVSD